MTHEYNYKISIGLSAPMPEIKEEVMEHMIAYYVIEMFNENKDLKFFSVKVTKEGLKL